ncbi:glutaredoxin domain-containing protein [soil metagenome]|jgi:glutaredoxin-like YruB-family protein
MSQAVVFTTSTCPWCKRVKQYLVHKGVSFKEVRVDLDERASRDLYRKTGQFGVPVTKIGGRWIVGFDHNAIDRELARKASQGVTKER